MDFRTLGPFEVLDADDLVAVPRQATSRACPAGERVGRVVAADRLADDLWDGDPPHAASSVLYSYVSKLRRALGGRDCPLVTRAPGYVLDVAPTDVDAHRFEALVREVEHTPDAPAGLGLGPPVRGAALWRGPALADFAGARWADDEAARLDEVRLRAIERRLDAELALGHHKAVVAEVEPLVAAYPLRERLCGQLMLGLYRSGRQAEALRAFCGCAPTWSTSWASPQP